MQNTNVRLIFCEEYSRVYSGRPSRERTVGWPLREIEHSANNADCQEFICLLIYRSFAGATSVEKLYKTLPSPILIPSRRRGGETVGSVANFLNFIRTRERRSWSSEKRKREREERIKEHDTRSRKRRRPQYERHDARQDIVCVPKTVAFLLWNSYVRSVEIDSGVAILLSLLSFSLFLSLFLSSSLFILFGKKEIKM